MKRSFFLSIAMTLVLTLLGLAPAPPAEAMPRGPMNPVCSCDYCDANPQTTCWVENTSISGPCYQYYDFFLCGVQLRSESQSDLFLSELSGGADRGVEPRLTPNNCEAPAPDKITVPTNDSEPPQETESISS